MADEQTGGVLGRQVDIPTTPMGFELDRIPNPNPARLYLTRFTIPEFTSLCPKTAQPDHATITIDMAPRDFLVESKSLKLYMYSFRSHGAFHEAVINEIHSKLVSTLHPVWLRTTGIFNPRGGIPIDVWCHYGELPHFFPRDQVPPLPSPAWTGR